MSQPEVSFGLDTFGDITRRPDGERQHAAQVIREFEREAGPGGSLYVGSPETVARKIAKTVRTLGLERFDLKYSNGPLPHEQSMRAIELYGTEVIPRVRDLLATSDQPVAV